MKWLLITNTGNRNPGDEWIRIGVQRLIREVDRSAEYILRNKEFFEDLNTPVEFDRAIWCGSPLFWSHEHQNCWDNAWWRAWMDGWLFKDPRKVLILGVGSVLSGPPKDAVGYEKAIALVKSKCWRLVTRQKTTDDPEIVTSCCPSIFAISGQQWGKGTMRLCNLMADGAHDGFLNQAECDCWHRIIEDVSRQLWRLGFVFVCHSEPEQELAAKLGWEENRVFLKPHTAEEYLPFYIQAGCYIGNRVHGAMLTISAGSPALLIGYDSRTEMVLNAWGRVIKPSEWSEESVNKWLGSQHPIYDWRPEWQRQLALVREFAGA